MNKIEFKQFYKIQKTIYKKTQSEKIGTKISVSLKSKKHAKI